jgi:hypothetical protein
MASTDIRVVSRTQNQTVKELLFRCGTRQSPTLVINLTKVGSTLSPEERRPLECNWPAYRGTKKICKFGIASMKICGNPRVNSGEHTRQSLRRSAFAASRNRIIMNRHEWNTNPPDILGSARASRSGGYALVYAKI